MDLLLKNTIIDIIDTYKDFFLSKENVHGIGLGYSVTCCYTKVTHSFLKN